MNNERKDKVLDYLSRPLDEVANLEKKNGRNTKSVGNGAYKKDGSWNVRNQNRRTPGFPRRGGKYSSNRDRRYYFKNSSYRGRSSRRTVSYRGRNTFTGPAQKYNSFGKFASSRTSRRGKGLANTSRRGLIRNTSRKIFKKPATSVRTVLNTAANTYAMVRPAAKKYTNMNISLHRKNETYPSSVNRAKDNSRIGRGVQNRTSTQGNNIVNGRKVVNTSRFEPLNKQALSKIKIVTSLQKVPSPLKEQQDTAVNLPESLNSMRR